MQIFEQKYITKNDISLYSTKYNISKIAFGSASRALCAAELRCLSANGRYLHLRCVGCGKATLFGYVVARGRGLRYSCYSCASRTSSTRDGGGMVISRRTTAEG